MAFQLDATAIAHVSMNPAVRDAAAVGAGLIELWPLTDAKQMDNDTKYGENLQVRMTRMAARVMTGDDVTVPDAEFVYEGADEIPGRPQRIVDALLAANDAYDEMGDYSETGDTRLIMRGAGQLGVDWDDDTVHAIDEALEAIEQAIGAADGAAGGAAAGAAAPANAAPSADVEAIAQRFATVTVAALVRNFDRAVVIGHTDDWTAITRHGEVVIAHHDTVIQPEDHVIVFCTRKKLVKKVEKLFQVGFHFL